MIDLGCFLKTFIKPPTNSLKNEKLPAFSAIFYPRMSYVLHLYRMCCDMNPHRYIMCLYSYHGRKHLQQIPTNHLDPLITQLRKNHQIIHCLKLTARPLKIGGNGRRLGSFPFGAISAYFAKVNLLLVLGAGSPYG